jgi:hypothetical protein
MLKFVLISLLVLLVLAYFFVQWSNRPENVQKMLEYYAQQKEKKRLDSLQKIEAAQKEEEIQRKTEKELHLVIDEDFTTQKINKLVENEMKKCKLSSQGLIFTDAIVTRRQNSTFVLALSQENYENFVAEMEFEVSNRAFVGLAYNFQMQTNQNWKADFAYNSSSLTQTIANGTVYRQKLKKDQNNSSFLKQKARFEKKGKNFKIIVNGVVMLDEQIEKYRNENGKIGLCVHYFNDSDWNTSVEAKIKNFKLWVWE